MQHMNLVCSLIGKQITCIPEGDAQKCNNIYIVLMFTRHLKMILNGQTLDIFVYLCGGNS